MVKAAYGNHFPGHIMSICKLNITIKAIREILTKQQFQLFKKNIFRHLIKNTSSYILGTKIFALKKN